MIKQTDSSTQSLWSASETECKTSFQPGGSATVTYSATTNRIKSKVKDKLDQWSYVLLDAKGNREIPIIMIYQFVKPTNPHGKSAYHQQRILLPLMDRPNTDPRTNMYKDLHSLIHIHVTRNKTCISIIMGDWNELSVLTSTSAKLCQDFGLVDVWHHQHPDNEFKTHLQGSRRIDFTITTKELTDKAKIIYGPFYQRLAGDHQGFYLKFAKTDLFRNTSPHIFETDRRI